MPKIRSFAYLSLLATIGLSGSALATEYVIVGTDAGLPNKLEAMVSRAGGKLTGTLPQINVAFATSDSPSFAGRIKGVQAVVPDFTFETPDMPAQVEMIDATPDVGGTISSIGDDESFFGLLWGMRAIDAPAAWDAGNTGAGVNVFVLDEGFDMDHPDNVLDSSMASSFVCYDIVGTDENGDPIVETNWANCEPVDYMLPDVFSHGTHTSGTIGAEDNGMGVIGVAPDANVVPVKVLSENLGYGFSSWIMRGIVYAADNGADVINMSLGGSTWQGAGPGSDGVAAWRVAYNRAVQYAYANGVTVVVSAGNSGINTNFYPSLLINPAMTSHAVTVSATGPLGIFYDPDTNLDEPAYYTNIGNRLVDFAAPGGNVDFSIYDAGGVWWYDMVLSTGNGGWYWSSGTSMAAPHVSGVAALIISENGGDMNPAHVKDELHKRAEDLGQPGNDAIYGKGRVRTGY